MFLSSIVLAVLSEFLYVNNFCVATRLLYNYRTQLQEYFLRTSERSKTVICFGHWLVLYVLLSPLIDLPIHSSKMGKEKLFL